MWIFVGPSHRQSLKDVVSQAQSVATFSHNSHHQQSGVTGGVERKKKSVVAAAVAANASNYSNNRGGGGDEPSFETVAANNNQTGAKPKQQKNVTLETKDSPKSQSSTLPPLKKKSVTVKETVPPPVPPRGSPRPSGSKSSQPNLRASYDAKSQNLSTGDFIKSLNKIVKFTKNNDKIFRKYSILLINTTTSVSGRIRSVGTLTNAIISRSIINWSFYLVCRNSWCNKVRLHDFSCFFKGFTTRKRIFLTKF